MSGQHQYANPKQQIQQQFEMAEEAFKANNFSIASTLARQVVEKQESYGPAWNLLAQIAETQHDYEKQKELAKRAIVEDQKNPKYYTTLAVALKHLGQVEASRQNLLKALQFDEKHTAALLQIGMLELECGELDSSYNYFKQYTEYDDANFAVFNNLGCIAAMSNLKHEAIVYFNKAIALNPDQADAYNNLGNIYFHQQKYTLAAENYDKALSINPEHADAYNNKGNLFKQLDELEKAKLSYEKAIELKPQHAEAINNLGSVLLRQFQFDTAINTIQRALELAPHLAEAYHNLGLCYLRTEKFSEAVAQFKKAISINPNNWETFSYLGETLKFTGDVQTALQCYQKAIEINPKHIETLLTLAKIYRLANQFDKSLGYLNKILQLEPHHCTALSNKLFIQLKLCQWDELKTLSKKLEKYAHEKWDAQQPSLVDPFEVLALPTSYTFTNQVAKDYADFIQAAAIDKKITHTPKTKKKLKVAYISPDFNQHPIGLQLRDSLKYHNREKFHITCYSLVKNSENPFTPLIEQSCDAFIDLHNYGAYQAAQRIKQDEIDILIDLAGFTGNAMPVTLAFQPAPVQCHWLGSPHSLCADFIQYFISHKDIVPATLATSFSEKLVYMPAAPYATPPFPTELPAVNKAQYGLPEDKFIFANFVQSYRITPQLFEHWIKILEQCPDSVLWLRADNEQIESNLITQACICGLTPDRFVFSRNLKLSDQWPHQLADLWLDSIEISSGTGTFLALWANLPLLSLFGDSPQSRTAAALLKSAELSDLIANDEKDYVLRATNFYRNRHILNQVRTKIKNNKHNFAIYKPQDYIHQLENAYLQMWEMAIQQKEPQCIDLTVSQ